MSLRLGTQEICPLIEVTADIYEKDDYLCLDNLEIDENDNIIIESKTTQE